MFSDFIAQTQRFLKDQFPATVIIGGVAYAGATGGWKKEFDMGEGLGHPVRKIGFTFDASVFAGNVPREESPLIYEGVEVNIKSVVIDPTGTNVKLDCEAAPS